MIAVPAIVVTDPLLVADGNALHVRSIGCLHDAKVLLMACARLRLGNHLGALLISHVAVRNLLVMAVAIQILATEAVLEEGLMRFVLHGVRLVVLVGHIGRVAVEDHGVVAARVLPMCSKHVGLCRLLGTAIALILIASLLMCMHVSKIAH